MNFVAKLYVGRYLKDKRVYSGYTRREVNKMFRERNGLVGKHCNGCNNREIVITRLGALV